MAVPDNYDQWRQRDRAQARWLESLPRCVNCGECIQQEDAIYLDCVGEWVCDECARNRKEVETD